MQRGGAKPSNGPKATLNVPMKIGKNKSNLNIMQSNISIRENRAIGGGEVD